MLHDTRVKDIDKWIDEELLLRFSKIHYFDPWDTFDLGYLLREHQYFCEYLDKHQQDSLVRSIYTTFTDFQEIHYVHMKIAEKCRNVMTTMERYCFAQNMKRLTLWALYNMQIQRQLFTKFQTAHGAPEEVIDMIFSYVFPLPQPEVITVQQFEFNMVVHYIDRPNLSGIYRFVDVEDELSD